MAKRVAREMTVEEFDQWSAATTRYEKVAEAADEVGGPRLSLVPLPEQNIAWPTDLLPPAIPPRNGEGDQPQAGGGAEPPVEATPFDGIPLESSRKRLAGWSADRQRLFLTVLAETGQVHLAAAAARLSVRSAQALRVRSPAFNAGWRLAEQLGVGRLVPMVFDRAINGRVEQVFHDGVLVAERRVPSDRLLTWLIARLDPKRFAMPWEQRGDADPQAEATAAFPELLARDHGRRFLNHRRHCEHSRRLANLILPRFLGDGGPAKPVKGPGTRVSRGAFNSKCCCSSRRWRR